MDENTIQDLKQFIDSRISQSEAQAGKRFDKLGHKIEDVDAKVDTIAEAINDQLNGHESRMTNLEQQTA